MYFLKKYWLKILVYLFFVASVISLIYRFTLINKNFNFCLLFDVNHWLIVIVIFFMLFNWSVEARKWQISTKYIEQLNISNSLKSVFIGVAVSLIFPNRTGEFLGKIMILKRQNRIKGIFASMLSSLSQLFVTLFLGSIGLFFFETDITFIKKYHYLLSYILLFSTFGIYILLPVFIRKYSFIFPKKLLGFIDFFGLFKLGEIASILLLSFVRYFTFLSQLYFLFMFFNTPVSIINFIILSFVSFLLTTIIPTTSFTELFLRNQVGLLIFSGLAIPDEIIISVFTLLWFINIAVPAIIGLIVGSKIKP